MVSPEHGEGNGLLQRIYHAIKASADNCYPSAKNGGARGNPPNISLSPCMRMTDEA